MKVLCKVDLVAEVLNQLGGKYPQGEELRKIVVASSNKLKSERGLELSDCLMLSPISGAALK